MYIILEGFASSVYTYNDHDGDVCVYAKMNVSFTVDYQCTDKVGHIKEIAVNRVRGDLYEQYGKAS